MLYKTALQKTLYINRLAKTHQQASYLSKVSQDPTQSSHLLSYNPIEIGSRPPYPTKMSFTPMLTLQRELVSESKSWTDAEISCFEIAIVMRGLAETQVAGMHSGTLVMMMRLKQKSLFGERFFMDIVEQLLHYFFIPPFRIYRSVLSTAFSIIYLHSLVLWHRLVRSTSVVQDVPPDILLEKSVLATTSTNQYANPHMFRRRTYNRSCNSPHKMNPEVQ